MLKRAFDTAVSSCGLILTFPVLFGLGLLVKWTSAGPVFYRGRRVGLHGRAFHIFKFRSMVIDAEKIGGSSTSDTDARITRIGKFMRKYKLDELPQLLNVVRGEMSLVGPRPEVQQYVDLYTEEEKEILTARPGITDWASIWNSDEGAILKHYADPDKAYEEIIRPTKLKLQLYYVKHHTLLVDLKIIAYTFLKLLRKESVPRDIQALTKDSPLEAHYRRIASESRDEPSFVTVTELPGHGATKEQISMLHTRYRFAAQLAKGKDVLELACGPGVGLGHLARHSRRVVAGDFDSSLVQQAASHYGSRFEIKQIDAQQLPFPDASFDVILLLEAIYYVPDVKRFVAEAKRVLRVNGAVMICSANCERPDFNASPFTHRYYSANELRQLLCEHGFEVEVHAGFPTKSGPLSGVLQAVRRFAVKFHLIPKTMAWKILLKKLIFGKLEPIPAELHIDEQRCEEVLPVCTNKPVTEYKVIYAVGRRAA